MEEPLTIFLQKDGKFFNKNAHLGHVSTVWNYPIRGHQWRIQRVVFEKSKSDFITIDERGQIYLYSVDDNIYSFVKKAASPISSVSFSPLCSRHLIITYANGALLLFDLDSKTVITSFPNIGEGSWTLYSGYRSPLVAVSDAKKLLLWNIK